MQLPLLTSTYGGSPAVPAPRPASRLSVHSCQMTWARRRTCLPAYRRTALGSGRLVEVPNLSDGTTAGLVCETRIYFSSFRRFGEFAARLPRETSRLPETRPESHGVPNRNRPTLRPGDNLWGGLCLRRLLPQRPWARPLSSRRGASSRESPQPSFVCVWSLVLTAYLYSNRAVRQIYNKMFYDFDAALF